MQRRRDAGHTDYKRERESKRAARGKREGEERLIAREIRFNLPPKRRHIGNKFILYIYIYMYIFGLGLNPACECWLVGANAPPLTPSTHPNTHANTPTPIHIQGST